ncbi:nicotinate phosphoribosyltransferase [Candidatus Legionella polyplacis]|uniref:nicotinate phosphoribosyltransferase n=1 Tax=Candidatus Legionella polyplacis TaxID=2005262 RepID=UPI000C1E192A|nr:nicotinate phosphoribosyltransferase [Candidatus Legionella polyplacis]ATW01709.1 nicotinate phosphoribosyltransferase [Candidatus Legionella polyplacis]
MFALTGSYIDHYQLTTAQVYFLRKKSEDKAIFDYFFRKIPFNGGYAIFAGLDNLLNAIEKFHFNEIDEKYFKELKYHSNFIDYLKNFRFNGTIYSVLEGEIVFPFCPLVIIEANLIEAQLIETILLNILNFQTLIATKASRIRKVAGNCQLFDCGLRRSQGLGGYHASRASIIGGFDSTSNVSIGRDYRVPVFGTMTHSFVQSYKKESDAFRDFFSIWPKSCLFLLDTYNTLYSGIPNTITVAKEIEKTGQRLMGVRLDSGDLFYLGKKVRYALNIAGLNYIKIAVSNQLNEYVIKDLLDKKIPIDIFGVGTDLVIGYPDAALDGVYKLSFLNHNPSIKYSDDIYKKNFPYKKQVYRILDEDGCFLGADVISLSEEHKISIMHHPFNNKKSLFIEKYDQEPLLYKVMEKGKRLFSSKELIDISKYSSKRLEFLPDKYKCFFRPSVYKVGLSDILKKKFNKILD